MKVTISWRNYANCPEATEYDKSRSYLFHFLGMFSGLTLFVLVIGFFICMGAYWTDADWGQFFGGLLCLLGGGALAHLVFVVYPACTERGIKSILLEHRGNSSFASLKKQEEKKIKEDFKEDLRDTTKSYYFWYLSVVVFILVVCVFIFSIVRMAMEEGGIGWLLFSLCAGAGSVFGFIRLKNIMDGNVPVKTKPVASRSTTQSSPVTGPSKTVEAKTGNDLYCHKCGRKLNILQAFCQSCGTPVAKNSEVKAAPSPADDHRNERYCGTPFIKSASMEFEKAKRMLASNPTNDQKKQAMDIILRLAEDEWCFEQEAFIIAAEHYESSGNYDMAIKCYERALKRGNTSAKAKILKLKELIDAESSKTRTPEEFYVDCLDAFHALSKTNGLTEKGVTFIPELLNLGTDAVLAYLQDKFFAAEYANDPATYYFVINSFAFQTGIVYASMWHIDYTSLKEKKAMEVIANGAWDYVEDLLSDLELTKETLNEFQNILYKEWISKHEPYWKLTDPRKYTFNAMLASYQLGVSVMLQKYGY